MVQDGVKTGRPGGASREARGVRGTGEDEITVAARVIAQREKHDSATCPAPPHLNRKWILPLSSRL